jgi:hypothetical protein
VGATQPLVSGSAQVMSVLADGSHSLTAQFIPTDPTAFAGSTSTAVVYQVGPFTTTTVLGVTPSSPAAHGTTETLTATVTPSAAVGTVEFFDGATQVGATQPLVSGSAQVMSVLADGSHSLTAQFIPTDPTAFIGSTSTAVAYTVTPAGQNASMTAIVGVGDFNGDGHPDLVGRDAAGDLWLYPGNGAGGFRAAVKIGRGWNIFI